MKTLSIQHFNLEKKFINLLMENILIVPHPKLRQRAQTINKITNKEINPIDCSKKSETTLP